MLSSIRFADQVLFYLEARLSSEQGAAREEQNSQSCDNKEYVPNC